jgi:hypothetical protein
MGKHKLHLIVFIIAAVALNTWQVILPNFHFDNSFCLAAARNVADGNGYTLKQSLPGDLSQVIYEPLNKWPPGYSWLLVGVMKMSGAGVITAVYIVNGLVIVCFLFGIYRMLHALKFSSAAINGFILFAGLFPYAFLGTWFADLAAVSFFTLAIGLILQANATGRHVLARAVAAAVLCGYCIFLKYLYLPVAILPLIVWGWYALRARNRVQVRAALTGSVIVMSAAIALLVYQSLHSGQPVYVNPTGRGFFPDHLLFVGPLIPASLIDQEFLTVQLDRLPFLTYVNAKTLLRILNYFLLAALFVWVYRWWRRDKVRSLYAYIVLAVSAVIAAMLIYLGVTLGPYLSEFTPFWTYVQELRYYAIVILFLQIWLFWYFVVHKPQSPGVVYRTLRVVVIAVVLVGSLHSAYYLVKQAGVKQLAGTNKLNEQEDIAALRAVEQLQKQHPGLVVCSNRHELANMVSLSGAPVLYNYDALNGELKTARPVALLAILHNDFLVRYQGFLQRYKPVKVDERHGFSFYLATIR